MVNQRPLAEPTTVTAMRINFQGQAELRQDVTEAYPPAARQICIQLSEIFCPQMIPLRSANQARLLERIEVRGDLQSEPH